MNKKRFERSFQVIHSKIIGFSAAKIVIISCLFFIFGIGLSSFVLPDRKGDELLFFGAAVGCGALALVWRHKKSIWFCLLMLACLNFGMWRYYFSLKVFDQASIAFYNGKKISWEGIVSDDPEIKPGRQRLRVRAIKIISGRKEISVYGKVLVSANAYPLYHYGDKLNLVCLLKTPEAIEDFAYDRYLARYDIYSICYYPQIIELGRGQGNLLFALVLRAKEIIRQVIDQNLSIPESGLVAGVLIGDTRDMDEITKNSFSRSGLSHLVAVSGLNITILAAVMMNLLFFVGLERRRAFYVATFFLIVYVVLVGLPASAVRAGLMGFLVLWAMRLGRLNKLDNATFLAAALMLIWNPKCLRDDIGFQLSFLAMLSLVYVFPIIDSAADLMQIPKLRGARDALVVTLAAQTLTWPVIAFNFKQISLVTPLSNLLVFWTSSVLMIISSIAILASVMIKVGSLYVFFPTWLLAKYIIWSAKWSSDLPFASISVDYFSWVWLLVYYLFLLSLILGIRKRIKLFNLSKKISKNN